MPRPFRPDDLYRFRIATDPRLSPSGDRVVFTVQTVAPTKDGYRHALWSVPTDGSREASKLTIGARNDTTPRFSPDGRTLAFLSDRRIQVEEEPEAGDPKKREDQQQVHLLPLDGGEARRLTDLPRGVGAFWWSPDGTRILVSSASHGATREEDRKRRGMTSAPKPGEAPESDYHFVDRLGYLANGAGFVYHLKAQLWVVDVATGEARRITDEPAGVDGAAWSPDGRRIAYVTNLRRDHDIETRSHLVAVDAEDGGHKTRLTGDGAVFVEPVWMPDGRHVAAIGGYLPDNFYRFDAWLIASDGSDASAERGGRNLTGRHDLMLAASQNSDIVPGETARIEVSGDGRWLTFLAPVDGSYELWRVATGDGSVERLTTGHHSIRSFHQVDLDGDRVRMTWLRASPTELNDVWVRDGTSGAPRRLTLLNRDVLAEVELREPVERWVEVDGRRIQGWYLPPTPATADGSNGTGRPSSAAKGKPKPAPLVTEIHGGPHTHYGWSPVLEFQLLAATGMGVYYSNPRGSDGYGLAFTEANIRDWGDGPMRDVLAGIESLVADGLADPERLGVTGGSYGGYLTNWIVGHDDRFAAAMTCRSVSDMWTLMLTGDIASGFWSRHEFKVEPWDDPAYFREISPIAYADGIRTPLLIQHSEKDIRTTVGQAEALFTVLRSKRRPVRLLRVPEETHELTRSGTPFRRVENLKVVRDWFAHFLVAGKRSLPPLPKVRAGR